MQAKSPILFRLLNLLVLLSLLAACGEEGEEGQPLEQITITFACPEWEKSTYRNLADQFEADNPDVRVQLVLLDPVSNLNEIVTCADTMLMPAFSPSLMRPNLLHDLSSFIETDETFHPQDFYPGILENLQRNGELWGLPFDVHFHLIFYDKEAFDAAGVPYPEPGWTWDEFSTKAQTLTEQEGDKVVRWGFAWRSRDPLPFIRGRAGPLVDTSVEPPVPLLDRPEAAEAVRWFTDLALKHRVMPVDDGQAAMWSGSTRNWYGESVGVAPFPVDTPTSATTPIQLRTYAMSAGTAHPQESWRWLAFLSQQPVGEGMPARRSRANGWWGALDGEAASTYRFALEHGFSPIESNWLGPALYDALEAILREEQTVEEALAQAQAAAYANIESELTNAAATDPFEVPTPALPDNEGTPIVFIATRTYWGKEDIYDTLADRFHELHPEITIEVRPPDLPIGTSEVTLQQMAAQGDCLEVFAAFLGGTDRSVLVNLDPLIEADTAFPLDDFYPHFLTPFRHKGQLWALPSEGYPRVMCYNKELFDAANLDYPSLDWTLDDFLILAQALTEEDGANKQYGYASALYFSSESLFFVEQQGARLVDDRADPVAFTLDTPAMTKAVQWYINLVRLYGIPPKFEDPDLDQWIFLIRNKRAAMWSIYPIGEYSSLWTMPETGAEVEVGVVPMPKGPGRVSDFDLIGYSISAQTKHPQACWEWFKFLSGQETFDGIPARRSIAESDAYRQQLDAELADAYRFTLKQSKRLSTSATHLRTERTGFILDQFRQALEAALNGEDVEQALSQAQHKVDEYILCLETTTGYEDEDELISTCTAQAEASRP